ncbi:DUF2000 domain-containing protein [Candidatus Peregrinibacteria bacterium CG_4_10_14_0_2_um_filter_43_11]|nr:MAG: DUF2000 domain-containing protein [Candidatus Peregrinibacteria bacterium CG_4_10_14_0_2_um_filter_43_11]
MVTKRFVAVLNKKIEPGKVMNALAHMTAGFVGVAENRDEMGFINYEDKEGGAHVASKYPFVVLSAKNSNKLRDFRHALIERGLLFTSFTEAMTVGTYQEQLDRSKSTPEAELEYYGVCTFGEKADLDTLTRKFSLWS